MPVIITGMMLFSCHPSKNLNPDEGLKAIKVLNSDLINLADGVSNNLAFSGLRLLLSEPTSPLSTENGLIGHWLNDTLTSLVPFSGNYSWNDSGFARTSGSDIINIDFRIPGQTTNQMNFAVSGFECKRLVSFFCFPLEISANMTDNNEKILTLTCNSEFIDELPSKVELNFEGDGFEGSVIAARTRKDDSGTLDISISLRARGFEIIEGSIHSRVGYSGSQVFFRTYEPDIRIFDVRIRGKLDYGKVDPTSKDYVKSFNDNCKIGFYDTGNKKKIGDFGIGELQNGELLGWMLYLSDGKPVLLEEQLLIVDKLLNLKLPNKVSN